MVELLVVIVIFAILMMLLIPAVLSVRASARRAQCQTNMRSIGQGLLAYEASTGRLPAGRDQNRMHDHSWATRILPNLDQQGLYDRYDWQTSWCSMGDGRIWTSPWDLEYVDGRRDDVRGNLQLAATNLSVFTCPETSHEFNGAIDYGGNYGSSISGLKPGFGRGEAWDSGLLVAANVYFEKGIRQQGVRMSEVVDGQSHTFMVIEDAGREPHHGGMWANGHNCFANELIAINLYRSNSIYSDHGNIAYAVLGDGSVMSLTDTMDSYVLGAMATRSGREATEHYE